MNEKETTINAKYYIEAGAFTPKEMSCYVLSAVRIEPHPDGGAVIVATDGHTMCVFHDKEGKCGGPVTVSFRPEIARLAKAKKGTTRLMRVNGNVDILERKPKEVEATMLVRFFDAIEPPTRSQFPDWRMVLPKESEAANIADFNGNYLARCAVAKQEFRTEGITIFQKDRNTQAVIRTMREDFVGIVMPMKIGGADDGRTAYPAYMQQLLKPTAGATPKAETAAVAAKRGGNPRPAIRR